MDRSEAADTDRTQEFLLFLRSWMIEGGKLPSVDTMYGPDLDERTVAEEICEIVSTYPR